MSRAKTAPLFTMLVHGTIVGAQVVADITMTRALGPEQVGAFVTAFSIAGLVAVLSLFGTGEVAIQMHIERADKHSGREIVGAGLAIATGGVSASLLVALAVGAALGVNPRGLGHIAWAVGVLAINTVGSVYSQAILARDLSQYDMAGTLASRLVLVGGVLSGAALRRLDVVFAAYTLSALVHSAWRARVVHRHAFSCVPAFRFSLVRHLWRRGSRVGVGAVFGVVSSRADVLALRRLSSVADVGLYGALSRVVTGMQLVTNAAALALFPALTRERSTGRASLASRAYRWLPLALSGGLVVFALTLAEPSVRWIFGEAWAGTGPIFALLCVSAAFQVCAGFASRWLLLVGQERVLPIAQGIGAALMVGGLIVLIPLRGPMGAAQAALVSDVAIVAVLAYGGWRASRVRREPVDHDASGPAPPADGCPGPSRAEEAA